MPVFGTQNFGSGGGTPDGSVTFTGKAGDNSNTANYSISVDCGDGGEMVVAAYTQGGSNPQISTFTLDGQAITVKKTQTDSSEVTLVIGTCSGVSSGTNTCVANWTATGYRCMVFVWKVEDVSLGAMRQVNGDAQYSLNMNTYTSGSVVIAATGTQSTTAFTGASGVTYDGNQSQESNAAAGSDAVADAATAISFTTSLSPGSERALIAAIELGTEDSDTTYRYWRLSIADGYNANEVAVGEVKIFVDTTQYPLVAMTGDSAPSPLVATGSSRDNSDRSYYKAFNRDVTSTDSHWASEYQAAYPQYVQVDLGSGNGIAATSYSVTAGKDGKETAGPKTFTLQGGHDGSTFSDINTQTGVSAWSAAEERTYTI
jgi:hypothetical protein